MRRKTGVSGSTVALLAAALAPAPSWALFNDTLEIFAAENVTYDSNVFRLSDNANTSSVVGSSQKHDTFYTTTVGFALDVPVSLQRFQLLGAWYDARYRTFKDLDHNGNSVRAAYLWSITPRSTGEISYQRTEALANFANIQERRPDLVTTQMALANGAWMMTPSWRLHGEATAGRTEHSDVRALNNLENATLEAGLSYVTAQENRIGVAVRGEQGRTPDEQTLFGQPFDNRYKQVGVGVQGRWTLTGHSRLDGRVDYTRREYEQLTQRDYSGPTFRATYTWTPTGKITVATTASRDVAPLEDITSSFVLVTGIAVNPEWAITDKINIRGTLAYAKWDYRGDALLGQSFEHRVKTAGISVVYRPALRIAITGRLDHETRTSTLALADYKADTASIEARIGF